jgi:hypothetical protein
VKGYAINVIEEYIFDEECRRAGISPDPRWQAILEGAEYSSVAFYDAMLASPDVHSAQKKEYASEREEALKIETALRAWRVEYNRFVEYPASRIFIALRDGSLLAEGRLLPSLNVKKAVRQADNRFL